MVMDNHPFSGQFAIHCFFATELHRHSDDRMSIHNDHRRWFHSSSLIGSDNFPLGREIVL